MERQENTWKDRTSSKTSYAKIPEDQARHNKTRQVKARRDMTRLEKTRRDKRELDKTSSTIRNEKTR